MPIMDYLIAEGWRDCLHLISNEIMTNGTVEKRATYVALDAFPLLVTEAGQQENQWGRLFTVAKNLVDDGRGGRMEAISLEILLTEQEAAPMIKAGRIRRK